MSRAKLNDDLIAVLKDIAEEDDQWEFGLETGDIPFLQQAAEMAGYRLSPSQAVIVWAAYSGMYCAGWLTVDRDNLNDVGACMAWAIEVASQGTRGREHG